VYQLIAMAGILIIMAAMAMAMGMKRGVGGKSRQSCEEAGQEDGDYGAPYAAEELRDDQNLEDFPGEQLSPGVVLPIRPPSVQSGEEAGAEGHRDEDYVQNNG
jgi:hypothetical protein